MQVSNKYEPLVPGQFYIDKTKVLRTGIQTFPSIYIEGAAASGKTTAVQMLLEKQPKVTACVFWMAVEAEQPEEFAERFERWIAECTEEKNTAQRIWFVFEDMDRAVPEMMMLKIVNFVEHMPENYRVIMIGRDRPAEMLLELLWKRRMTVIPQENLLFSIDEVRKMVKHAGCMLSPEEIFEETGGWAGAVSLILQMAGGKKDCDCDIEELRNSYEFDAYIRSKILGTFSPEEQGLLQYGGLCPWLNEKLCREVYGIADAADILDGLAGKGILLYERGKKRWKIAPLFRRYYLTGKNQAGGNGHQAGEVRFQVLKRLQNWYEANGYIKETMQCLKLANDAEGYQYCIQKYYDRVPFLDISYGKDIALAGDSPEMIYLKGMYAYAQQEQSGLAQEISRLGGLIQKKRSLKGDDIGHRRCAEVYLNLMYVNADVSMTEWMALLEKTADSAGRIRLYGMLGGGASFLCGLRDLTALFACSKKEENHWAHIWQECLGKTEWKAYQLARMDYYVETERLNELKAEDKKLLEEIIDEEQMPETMAVPMSEQVPEVMEVPFWGRQHGRLSWQFRLAAMQLLCQIEEKSSEGAIRAAIRKLSHKLSSEDNHLCVQNTRAVACVYELRCGNSEKSVHWLLDSGADKITAVGEKHYYLLYCQAKVYLLLSQYKKADRLLQRIIPYLRKNRRHRYLAESLFMEAIINWDCDRRSQTLQRTIESFLVSKAARYVAFYIDYGVQGREVLEMYVEWLRTNSPEGWHRKKKYNYGSVLKMPVADYMETLLRYAKRKFCVQQKVAEEVQAEHLTMMETVILQEIGKGLSNAQMCETLNLKPPTVKSHVYSLYKKLGVNSRVQAVIKGKERGFLD